MGAGMTVSVALFSIVLSSISMVSRSRAEHSSVAASAEAIKVVPFMVS